ncbi:astakine [Xylocopa sonorina]|uniref:astakine n=1 Tax=Xylocopa sonorina TaxID=1818115 RepID=UPI00403B05F6
MKIAAMTPISFTFVLLLLGLVYTCHAQDKRPDYIQCENNSECPSDNCCVLGPYRYSYPQCLPRITKGEICRPSSSSTQNMTLEYPNGLVLKLTDVHYILCPCADGLSCDLKEGVCK